MNQTILHKITHARKVLILDYPFWGNLALRLTLKEDPSCKRGWTDGRTLGYNPDWIETLSDVRTIGWCAHEVCHPMCQHHTRRGGRNKSLWNRACDYVINSILVKEGFALPGHPLLDLRFDGMSADEVFNILETEREAQRKAFDKLKRKAQRENSKKKDESEDDGSEDSDSKGEGQDVGSENEDKDESQDNKSKGNGQGNQDQDSENPEDSEDSGEPEDQDSENEVEKNEDLFGPHDNLDPDFFDDDPDPGDCGEVRDYPGHDGKATPSELKQEEQEQKIATVQAANQAKSYGHLPAGLDREIKNLIEPKVDPRDLLQRFVAMSAKNDFAWMPPNRRYIYQGLYMPSLKSEKLGTVVLVLDTSISIGQKELDQWSAIISAILEAYIIDAIVLYCDTMVYEPEYYKREDLPLELKMKGGGGTDFKPPFKWVEDHTVDPVCLIYLTDLECDSYPEIYPDYPVVWVSTNPEDKIYWGKPPFGEIIYIDLEEER
jgi:predicted metal-dependent peptidase